MLSRWKNSVLLQSIPPLYWWMLVGSLCCAMVPTWWTQLDLKTASLFDGATAEVVSASWWWVEWLNVNVPFAFRVALGLVLIGWFVAKRRSRGAVWRLPLVFIFWAGVMGPGIVVNAGVKDNWQRARPYQVENFGGTQQFTRAAVIADQCTSNCSFVSGHVACGFFLTSLMLIHRRRQVAWAVTGTAAGLIIGFARMSAMDHWLSDVLWAYPITLLSSLLVWIGLSWLFHQSRADHLQSAANT